MATKDRSRKISSRYFSFNSYNGQFNALSPYLVLSATQNFVRLRDGVSVPKWQEKIKNHEDATSNFNGTYDTLDIIGDVSGVFKYTCDSTGFPTPHGPKVVEERLTGSFIGTKALANPYYGSGFVGNADGRASNKFLSEVRATQSQFSAPTFLGELRETQRMLRRPAAALWENLLGYEAGLKKAKRRNPKRWIYSIPDLWLEHSFGWRPLMMDIEDAWNTLLTFLDQEHVKHISKAGVDNRHVDDTYQQATPNGLSFAQVTGRRIRREEAIVRYRGDVVVQAATTFADKAARWGFNPSEFVATAWELLPWSFLVDYFTTIGDFIDASGARTSSLKWVCKTVRKKSRDYWVLSYDPIATTSGLNANFKASIVANASLSKSPAQAIFERRSITRTSGTVPLPDLSIRWEGPKWGQIANMAALLGSFNANLHFQTPSRRNYRL